MNITTLEAQYLYSWLFLEIFYHLVLCVQNGNLICPLLEPSRRLGHEPLMKDSMVGLIGGVSILSPALVHTMGIEELKISFHAWFLPFVSHPPWD